MKLQTSRVERAASVPFATSAPTSAYSSNFSVKSVMSCLCIADLLRRKFVAVRKSGSF